MKILRDESGQAVVVFATFMGLVMVGFLALALDVGMLFEQKRSAQAAADAAAIAAAEEIAYKNPSNKQNVADAMAKMNGFDTTLATNPATVTLQQPASGNFANSAFVQATVSKPVPTFFLGAFNSGMSTVSVSGTSIAGGGVSSPTCVCVTNPIVVNNGAKISASSCGVFDNSSGSDAIQVAWGSSITAQTVASVSPNWDNSTSIPAGNAAAFPSPTVPLQGVATKCAAPAIVAPPYVPASCGVDPGGAYGTHYWGPPSPSGTKCYQALSVGKNGSTDTLNPGIYVITTGALHFYSGNGGKSNLGGNGVFIYLTGTASLLVDNGANVNLVSGNAAISGGGTAPDLGAYDGTVIYQDPNDTAAISFQGGSSSYINGAMIAPGAGVTIGNGSGATMNGGVVSNSLTLNGGGTFTFSGTGVAGSVSVISSHPRLVQ